MIESQVVEKCNEEGRLSGFFGLNARVEDDVIHSPEAAGEIQGKVITSLAKV
jgi:hypothetical protein